MAMRSWTVSYLRLAIPPEGPGGEGDLVVLVAEQQVQLHSPHRLPSFLHRLDFDDGPKDFPDNFIVVLLNEITKWFKEEKCRMKIELSSIVYNYFRHRSYHYELSSFLYISYANENWSSVRFLASNSKYCFIKITKFWFVVSITYREGRYTIKNKRQDLHCRCSHAVNQEI